METTSGRSKRTALMSPGWITGGFTCGTSFPFDGRANGDAVGITSTRTRGHRSTTPDPFGARSMFRGRRGLHPTRDEAEAPRKDLARYLEAEQRGEKDIYRKPQLRQIQVVKVAKEMAVSPRTNPIRRSQRRAAVRANARRRTGRMA